MRMFSRPPAGSEGQEPGDELTEAILGHLRERLAKFKLPRSIDYIAEMPRDPSGKLYIRRLRDRYWADQGRNI